MDEKDIPDSISENIEESEYFERVVDTMKGIRTYAPVEDIASLAMCEQEEAQKVLDILYEFKIIEKEENKYRRSERFIQWLRANALIEEYNTKDSLEDIEKDIEAEIEVIKKIYRKQSPYDMEFTAKNDSLAERIQKDANKWIILEQTQSDIDLAKAILNAEIEIDKEENLKND